MNTETEVKFTGADLAKVRRALHRAGASRLACRAERNEVLDDVAGSLKGRDVLLRLRDDGRSILTVKSPAPQPSPEGLKTRIEHESEVADLAAVRAGLGALGYAPVFAYEKVREEWEFLGCHVCLDALCFGSFVEIEGEPRAIRAAADALGLDWARSTPQNYHRLHAAWRAANGLAPQDSFVLTEAQRSAALALFAEEFDVVF